MSSNFRKAIYSAERQTKGRVSFEILDIEAYNDASIVVTTNAPLSRPDQVINKVREMSHSYATFERDYFKLDGSSFIPPLPTEGDSELGWWNDVLSMADGTYVSPPILDFMFQNPHSSIGLTFTFDTINNEYASEFQVETYDSANVLLTSERVFNNSSVYVYETPLENYHRIKISILKWSKPSRRAKIVEVDFGVIREYTGEKLISLKVIEEMDLLSSVVPSNELSFTLDNTDNTFNILNPNGIYKFIKPNQEMTASIGLKVGAEQYEFVPLGKYYLTEWTVEEGSMTSTFVGRDIFTKLDAENYTRLLQNTNLYDLALDIFAESNIEKFEIDESLKLITTVGFTEVIKVREALQMIAMASKSAIRQGRNGSVIIEQYDELAFETGYITFAGTDVFAPTTPQTNVDYTFQTINFENAYEIPKLTLVNAVSMLVFKLHTATGIVESKILNPKVVDGIGYEINNPLINTHEHAQDIANYMFREYNSIAEYQATWRQNPALECGNVLLIEDRFGSNRKARITKQEINFAGYLEGVTEAKGGI